MKKFEVGKIYWHGRISDSESFNFYKVVRRTAKSVWIKEVMSQRIGGGYPEIQRMIEDATIQRKTVKTYQNEEVVKLGNYSFAPSIGARYETNEKWEHLIIEEKEEAETLTNDFEIPKLHIYKDIHELREKTKSVEQIDNYFLSLDFFNACIISDIDTNLFIESNQLFKTLPKRYYLKYATETEILNFGFWENRVNADNALFFVKSMISDVMKNGGYLENYILQNCTFIDEQPENSLIFHFIAWMDDEEKHLKFNLAKKQWYL